MVTEEGTTARKLPIVAPPETTFFFDLDGTLTDPKPGITGCIQHALECLGRPVLSKDELEWCIGPPLLENFQTLVGDADAADGVKFYRERFGDIGLFENEVYPGIVSVLTDLAEQHDVGVRLYVASSKPLVYVQRILDHFKLSAYFDRIFGSELDGTRTDKADLLCYALQETGAAASRSTMVGDRGVDAIGARANAMRFLGVLYGYGSAAEFEAAGATRFVERPDELPGALFQGE